MTQLAVKIKVNLQSSFACMELTLSPRNRQLKVLPADTQFHLFAKVFLPIRCFAHSIKFSTTKVLHYTVLNIEKLIWYAVRAVISRSEQNFGTRIDNRLPMVMLSQVDIHRYSVTNI